MNHSGCRRLCPPRFLIYPRMETTLYTFFKWSKPPLRSPSYEMDRCAQTGKSLLVIPQWCLGCTWRLSIHLISNNDISELSHKLGHYHLQFSGFIVWKLIFWNTWIWQCSSLLAVVKKSKSRDLYCQDVLISHTTLSVLKTQHKRLTEGIVTEERHYWRTWHFIPLLLASSSSHPSSY